MMVKNRFLFFVFVSLLAMLFACQPTEKQLLIENSKKFLPTAEEKKHVIQKVEEDNKKFDPAFNALKIFTPTSANHYHSKRVGIDNHPTRSAAHYAVQLLETGIPEYQQRALKVIKAVLAVQDVNKENSTYGIWPYHFEEPLPQMNRPDWNWADFISVQLLEAYMQYQDVIPEDLLKKMEESIIHASYSIKKRDVKPGYTNIAIMGTLVTHLAGHLFDNQELKDYADMRMKRFYNYTKKLGGFVEYNSPTYTRVALDELVRMKQYILDPATLEMVDFCYYTGWKVLSNHFHAPTGRLAGPHSRSYSTLHRASFFDFLYGASDGKVKIEEAKKPVNYYKLQHKIPLDLLANFLETPVNRIQVDTFSLKKNPPVGYSYLTPTYSFGSVNRCTTWKQRRPYIVYWGQQGDVKFLRVKLMHDNEDFGIGNIFTVQNENESLTAMNFATNGGDYHISIDRLKDAKFAAKDVRLRFEMRSAEAADKISLNKNGFSLKDGHFKLEINMLKSVFGKQKIEVKKGGNDDLAWVDYIIYNGAEKVFDLTEIDEACFAWQTIIQPEDDPKAALLQSDNQIEIKSDKMSLAIPVKPALEEELQNAFVLRGNG